MNPDEFIARFGRHVDALAATVFIGAGLSMPAGYPDWITLLDPLCKELGIDPIGDLPQLAQYYEDSASGGRSRLERHVTDALIAVGNPEPELSHHLLAELPVSELWTTNYDSLVERALTNPSVFTQDAQLAQAVADPDTRRIYKMHGSIDPPSPIVITRDDYDRYPERSPRFWQLLCAEFLTKTFLFLGFGFNDPNLELVFKLARLRTAEIPREHFTILKRPNKTVTGRAAPPETRLFDLKAIELQRAGINVVIVDSYEDISEVLGKLVARCRPPQLMISGSAPTPRGRTGTGHAYPTGPISDDLAMVAQAIGERLAESSIAVVGGGPVAGLVGYQMMRSLIGSGGYEPSRFTLVRRQGNEALTEPNLRLGRILFTGDRPTDLRSAALGEVRALLVLGGAEGTQEEIDQALAAGLGVVPVARSGGTAEAHWRIVRDRLSTELLGGRPISADTFNQLASGDTAVVVEAAVALSAQALYLD